MSEANSEGISASKDDDGAPMPDPTAASRDVAEQSNTASASKHAASGTKRSRDSVEDTPAQPEPKRRRSAFHRCFAAFLGWLFSSTPGTASAASGASADPVSDVPKNQEIHPETPVLDATNDQETSSAEEVAVSEGAHSEGGPSAAAEPSLEESAAAVAAHEAQHHATEPIAAGVFVQRDWPTEYTFVAKLEPIFDADARLKAEDSSPPQRPVRNGAAAAETPAVHGLQDSEGFPGRATQASKKKEAAGLPTPPWKPPVKMGRKPATPAELLDHALNDLPIIERSRASGNVNMLKKALYLDEAYKKFLQNLEIDWNGVTRPWAKHPASPAYLTALGCFSETVTLYARCKRNSPAFAREFPLGRQADIDMALICGARKAPRR